MFLLRPIVWFRRNDSVTAHIFGVTVGLSEVFYAVGDTFIELLTKDGVLSARFPASERKPERGCEETSGEEPQRS